MKMRGSAWTGLAALLLPLAIVGAPALLSHRPARAQAALLVPAPELTGDKWINTPDNKPVTLASRKGKVTIVHFWTFG